MTKEISIQPNNNLLSFEFEDDPNNPYNPLAPQTTPIELITNINSEVSPFFKIKSIDGFLHNFIQIALIVASISTLFYLLWGGIEYLTSGGEQEKAKSAKSKITQAIAGLAITAIVWIFWRLIVYFLGISSTPGGTFKINLPKL